jgi:hypothetical protein
MCRANISAVCGWLIHSEFSMLALNHPNGFHYETALKVTDLQQLSSIHPYGESFFN